MRIIKYCLLAMLWPAMNNYAQSPTATIHPLSIGDSVPDIEFTNVINSPVSKIHLSDLKGKLVILDFWGQYCAPCIQELPVLDSLQRKHKDQIRIITISDFTETSLLKKTLNRFIKTRDFQLPVLLADKTLSALFPHLLVSHVVWIDKAGEIRAITGTDYVTERNIQTVLDKQPVNWPVKKDMLGFDYRSPLLQLAQSGLANPRFLYYSTFTGYLDGIAPPAGTFVDSGSRSTFTGFYNYDLPALCQTALDYSVGASRDQFILRVKDTTKYMLPQNSYYESWRRNHTYCYYIRLPLGLSDDEIKSTVKQDLTHWLSTMGIQIAKQTESAGNRQKTRYIISENRSGTFY
ncbi:MAG: TlpA disulfide reductase family protein [Bacteroidota bacterium]|nr:TlpA disulfide reductase family protein [Bacteroidota bacterium]